MLLCFPLRAWRPQPREIQEHVLGKFEPHFVNTYLTSTTAANMSLEEGQ
jgi:hypothetical protein